MNYLSRTDLNLAQLPAVIPKMGPAGSIITDPDFGCRIVRATDGSMPSGGQNWIVAGLGGSADANVWNKDSTLLYVENSGGGGLILQFDPITMAVKRLFPSLHLSGGCVFSKIDPNVLFNLSGTQFMKYDLSNRSASAPPAPAVVCDFASLLGGTATWRSLGGVEHGDTVFTAGFSTTGVQNTGAHVCAYVVGKGYRDWNTSTGAITGDWGPKAPVSIPERFPIHNVKASKGSGQWVIVTPAPGTDVDKIGACYWNFATCKVFSTGHIAPGGHWVGGESYFISNSNDASIPFWAHAKRFYTAPGTVIAVANPCPTPGGAMAGLDDHLSLNGPPGVMMISISADQQARTIFPAPWYNEVLGFDLSGSGKVFRFCHTFASGKTKTPTMPNGNFYSDNAIGAVDQQNKFVCFTSDWMGTLGRSADVFIVALR